MDGALARGLLHISKHEGINSSCRPGGNSGCRLTADATPSFVPVVVDSAQANKAAYERRPAVIEIVIGAIKVRVLGGANTRDVAAVLRAVRCSQA